MPDSIQDKNCSAFYITRPGFVKITGPDALSFLHRLCTQNLKPLHNTLRGTRALFTTPQGKLLDWVWIGSMGHASHNDSTDYLLVQTAPDRALSLCEWLRQYIIMDQVETCDVSSNYVCMDVFGDVVNLLFDTYFKQVKPPVLPGQLWVDGEMIWHAGLTALGLHVQGCIPQAQQVEWQNRLLVLGAEALTNTAFHTRRVIAGVPSAEYEYAQAVNPLELRLAGDAIAWNKGCYIGQEVISRLDSYGKVARLLMGFFCTQDIDDKQAQDARILQQNQVIGRLTSWVKTPFGTVGLALVKQQNATIGLRQLQLSQQIVDIELQNRHFWDEKGNQT